MVKNPLLPFVAALFLSLGACVDYTAPEYVERPVGEIYNDGMDTLNTGRFREASAIFDEVERQHPYSTWATSCRSWSLRATSSAARGTNRMWTSRSSSPAYVPARN